MAKATQLVMTLVATFSHLEIPPLTGTAKFKQKLVDNLLLKSGRILTLVVGINLTLPSSTKAKGMLCTNLGVEWLCVGLGLCA